MAGGGFPILDLMTLRRLAMGMRAIAIPKLKAPPVLMDLPRPKPAPGEVLVHLAAAGVNPYDWKIADGVLDGIMPHVFPLILGVDGAGVVEEVGSGVTRFAVGDGIFGQFLHAPVGIGTYAEFVVAPETIGLAKVPRGIYSAQAAAVPTAGMTALSALDTLGLTRSQTLLIMGAGGGIGSFATQLASNQGIRALAGSRGANRDFLHKLGASRVYDTESSSYFEELKTAHPDGVDGLLDLVQRGDAFEKTLSLVRKGGVVGSTIGAVDPAAMTRHGLRGTNIDLQPSSALLDRLSVEILSGRMRIPVDTQRPLAEAPEALELSRSGKARGKTVLMI
jgi:NADPH:quinone reductase-like Zn-dependent oxidoreductase